MLFCPERTVVVNINVGFGSQTWTVTLTPTVSAPNPKQIVQIIALNICVPIATPIIATVLYSAIKTVTSPIAPITVNLIAVFDCRGTCCQSRKESSKVVKCNSQVTDRYCLEASLRLIRQQLQSQRFSRQFLCVTTVSPLGFLNERTSKFACLSAITVIADGSSIFSTENASITDVVAVTIYIRRTLPPQTLTLNPPLTSDTNRLLSLIVPVNICVNADEPITATVICTTGALIGLSINVTVIALFDFASACCDSCPKDQKPNKKL